MPGAEPPAGFIEFSIGRAWVVCAEHVAGALRAGLGERTLYEFAATTSGVSGMAGRGAAYAVPLPGDVERVVVRHNRHGGLFAPLTRDLFRSPTRAPLELEISERLRHAGVPTPAFLGYAIYPAPFGLSRADVMTREVSASTDLSHALMSNDPAIRSAALGAAAALIVALSAVGARHHDLNIKNVLLQGSDTPTALLLDVDRVTFGETPDSARQHNVRRILRSAYQWQHRHGALVSPTELGAFADDVRGASLSPTSAS